MRCYIRKGMAFVMAVLLLGMTACGRDAGELSNSNKATSSTEEKSAGEVQTDDGKVDNVVRTATVTLKDKGSSISGTGCEVNGNCLEITKAGTYEISGTLSNGSIYVNTDKKSEVHLILNGVTLHNETGAAVFCNKAEKVVITLAEGSVNNITDGAEYVFAEGQEEPDATLYAKCDLVIGGSGTLKVTSAYADAIKGKDSLYILGGNFMVDSVDDGIVGRDLLHITGGSFDVRSMADALKASNDEDAALGNVLIEGGVFQIASGDDAVHAEAALTVQGNTNINVSKSYEGLEAQNITISGGDITIVASDDGLNAAGGADGSAGDRPGAGRFGEDSGEIVINGGVLTVNAAGDGIDSNGNLTVNGGSVLVFGPTNGGNGVLDYGGSFLLNGGTLLCVGSAEMAQTPANASGQYSLAAALSYAAKEGAEIEITVNDVSVLSAEAPKSFRYIVASTADFAAGAEVAVLVNGEKQYSGVLEETVTCFGITGGMGGFGGMGDFGGGKGGRGENGPNREWPKGEVPEPPGGEDGKRPSGEIPDFLWEDR